MVVGTEKIERALKRYGLTDRKINFILGKVEEEYLKGWNMGEDRLVGAIKEYCQVDDLMTSSMVNLREHIKVSEIMKITGEYYNDRRRNSNNS